MQGRKENNMTEHEIRVERMLQEILHLLTMFAGLSKQNTSNPKHIEEMSLNSLNLYDEMKARLDWQIMHDNEEEDEIYNS